VAVSDGGTISVAPLSRVNSVMAQMVLNWVSRHTNSCSLQVRVGHRLFHGGSSCSIDYFVVAMIGGIHLPLRIGKSGQYARI
jgi:hypothetical protein